MVLGACAPQSSGLFTSAEQVCSISIPTCIHEHALVVVKTESMILSISQYLMFFSILFLQNKEHCNLILCEVPHSVSF